MAVSREERLKRKREAEKERRKRIFEDPDRLKKENQKRRDRYQRKQSQPETAKERRLRQMKWKLDKRKYSKGNKKATTTEASVLLDPTVHADNVRREAKRLLERKRKKHRKQLEALELENKQLRKRVRKVEKRNSRLKEVITQNSKSPNSVLNRQLKEDGEMCRPLSDDSCCLDVLWLMISKTRYQKSKVPK
jgi:hypothetical protein